MGRRGAASVREKGLEGGTPQLWDRFHAEHNSGRDAAALRASAPERALLAAALSQLRLNAGDTLAELGCGASRFLPAIAASTGARICGVDFSQTGVEQTRRALTAAGFGADGIVLDTVHAYAERNLDGFDAVASFGLVEHFTDLDDIVQCHFACARPGGRIFIGAPNLSALNLWWASLFSPSTMQWHVPIEADAVEEACRRCGGTDVSSSYLGGPRLFARADRAAHGYAVALVANAMRKTANGLDELLHRISARLADRVGGSVASAYFAVAATKGR